MDIPMITTAAFRTTSLKLYQDLAGVFESREGNLFEQSDVGTMLAQARAIEWAVKQCRPRSILETGTNKGYFGLMLSWMQVEATLYTFDRDERAMMAAALLGDGQESVRVVFTLGDTKETLRQLTTPIDLAWIDGGHDVQTARSDIWHAMRLGARWILIDDAKQMASVAVAVLGALDGAPYERVDHPWYRQDARGMAVLRRLTDVL